jgi:hypothetical protein
LEDGAKIIIAYFVLPSRAGGDEHLYLKLSAIKKIFKK